MAAEAIQIEWPNFQYPEGNIAVKEGDTAFILENNTMTVAEGKTLTVEGDLTVYGKLEVKGDLTIEERGTLTVEEDATLTVNGTLTIDDDGKLENKGKIDINVSATDGLSPAIAAARKVSESANTPEAETTVNLTKAFYDAANGTEEAAKQQAAGGDENGTLLVIEDDDEDADADSKQVVIKGLGKTGENIPSLNVGVAISSPNITLTDVNINVSTNIGSTAKLDWGGGSFYRSALAVATIGDNNLVTNSVTGVIVDNCEITITNSSTENADAFTSGVYVHLLPNGFTINKSTVTATGKGSNATAALMFHRVPKELTITDNKLLAEFATPSGKGIIKHDAPATAIFINRVADDFTCDLELSGNTYGLSATAPAEGQEKTQYSLFMNASGPFTNGTDENGDGTAATDASNPTGTDALRNYCFATFGSTWATVSEDLPNANNKVSIYKQILNAHIADIDGEDEVGFAYVGERAYSDPTNEVEQYRIKDKKNNRYQLLRGLHQNRQR
jgi:hypothetical protein